MVLQHHWLKGLDYLRRRSFTQAKAMVFLLVHTQIDPARMGPKGSYNGV
jgi:hypothetical protein